MYIELKTLKREREDIKWCLQLYSSELGDSSRARKYKRLNEISKRIDEIEKILDEKEKKKS